MLRCKGLMHFKFQQSAYSDLLFFIILVLLLQSATTSVRKILNLSQIP